MNEETETKDPAWETYLAALVTAAELMEKACAPAIAAYEATKRAAWEAYHDAWRATGKAYDSAIRDAPRQEKNGHREATKDMIEWLKNEIAHAQSVIERCSNAGRRAKYLGRQSALKETLRSLEAYQAACEAREAMSGMALAGMDGYDYEGR